MYAQAYSYRAILERRCSVIYAIVNQGYRLSGKKLIGLENRKFIFKKRLRTGDGNLISTYLLRWKNYLPHQYEKYIKENVYEQRRKCGGGGGPPA